MKKFLDWQLKEVADIYDEVPLWSAPFGKLLLDNIPMKPNCQIVDIGFGTGFPLIELAQRFGKGSHVYGVDLWHTAIQRAKQKIQTLQIDNISIFEQNAENIPLEDNTIDLVSSNLGINNFENKIAVLKEAYRILKPGGKLCITTNPIGTFHELFSIFQTVIEGIQIPTKPLEDYIAHRSTKEIIIHDFTQHGFQYTKAETDTAIIRFASAQALFDHGLLRIGFRESWGKLIPNEYKDSFFEQSIALVQRTIDDAGSFVMSIPILYMEFEKKA